MLPTILPGGGRSTPVSLDLPEGLAFDAWAGLGERLAAIERSAAWWLGDWWAYGEHRYGDRKALVDALSASGRDFPSFQTCMGAGSVSRAFGETLRRRKVLSFAHHREVMALSADDQDELLDAAAAEGWSSRELRAEVGQEFKVRAGAGWARRRPRPRRGARSGIGGGTLKLTTPGKLARSA